MRYWTGVLFFAIGAWLLYAAFTQRRRVLAARREAAVRAAADPAGTLHPSLAMLGHIFPPLVIAGLVYVGIKTTLVYVVLQGQRVFSLFDLAGFLFVLAAYGTWLLLKSRYSESGRPVVPVAAPAAGLRVVEGGMADELGSADPVRTASGAGRRTGAGGVGAPLAGRDQAAVAGGRRRG